MHGPAGRKYLVDRYTYFSDPVHGFIAVNNKLMPLVESPEMQRLRRISQFGTGNLVFPVGEHSRFTHALGAMALMGDTLQILKGKGTPVSEEERLAAMAAMLLHDLGHTPFSHALEYVLLRKTRHEEISLALMNRLADRFGSPFDLAARMFAGNYQRTFFQDLLAGQLDMDRLDFLRRDSHLSGVMEGRIGVQRILQTMQVHPLSGGPDAYIVVEAKGIHAVENVLTARRHMYWQVYLHKAVLAADAVLVGAIRRARHLMQQDKPEAVSGASPALQFFLERDLGSNQLSEDAVLDAFVALDDADVIFSLKQWCNSSDQVLSDLSRRFVNRDLFRCVFIDETPEPVQAAHWENLVLQYLHQQGISDMEAIQYYFRLGHSGHSAYEDDEGPIRILYPDGTVKGLAESADTKSIAELRNLVVKPFVCYPKEVRLPL